MLRVRADLALVIVTLIWGTTFVVVKQTLDMLPPLVLIAARFWVAGLALLGVWMAHHFGFWILDFGSKRQSQKPEQVARRATGNVRALLREGALTGVVLTGGFVTQTMGLQTTAAGKSAFITGLSVIIVPALAALLLRKPPARAAVVGVALATVGMGLLTLDSALRLAPGDLWTLACAGCFALHIVCTAHFAPRHAALPFTLAQLFTVAALTTLAAAFAQPQVLLAHEVNATPIPNVAELSRALPAVLYLGLAATAVVFGLQTWAQRHTSPTHTALIFTLEPVFAAIFALLLTGEVLARQEWIGGGLILIGMLLAELWPASSRTAEVPC
ncbi:MAG: DMT family transporter [Anaerolineae bacterium]|nr:DMT family transporter [Anaerolineae bacterium]